MEPEMARYPGVRVMYACTCLQVLALNSLFKLLRVFEFLDCLELAFNLPDLIVNFIVMFHCVWFLMVPVFCSFVFSPEILRLWRNTSISFAHHRECPIRNACSFGSSSECLDSCFWYLVFLVRVINLALPAVLYISPAAVVAFYH